MRAGTSGMNDDLDRDYLKTEAQRIIGYGSNAESMLLVAAEYAKKYSINPLATLAQWERATNDLRSEYQLLSYSRARFVINMARAYFELP